MNEASWSDVQMEDTLGLEVGYRLIPMVDHEQQGQLLTRVRGIRKKFAQQMGFLPPAVHIRDNLDLAPTHYRILLKGVTIGSGEVQPDRWMAINPGCAEGKSPARRVPSPPLVCLRCGLTKSTANWRRRWATRWWIRVQWWQRTLTI